MATKGGKRLKLTPAMHFAQQLAANEEKIRNRAVQKLRRWLSSQSNSLNAFTEEEFMKLWKGLFYCMWMSDKPLVQEDLSERISKLIHCFGREDYACMFIDAFFCTISREWFGIDRFRLEIFMLLIRRFLRESFEHVRKMDWKIQSIKCLRKVLKKTVLSPNSDKTPLGLKIHIADVYVDELSRVGGRELTSKQALSFLVPYCHILAKTNDMYFLSNVVKLVFIHIMYQSEVCMSDEDEEVEEDKKDIDDHISENCTPKERRRKMTSKLECNQSLPVIEFDYTAVGDLLMKYASTEKIRRKNQIKMYKLVKQFRDLAEGINPFDRSIPIDLGRGIKKKDIDKAAKRLLEDDLKFREEKKEWKRKKANKTK